MQDAATFIPCHARTVRSLDNPIVFVRNGTVFANSEDVANFFGKQHSHVLRSIRLLIATDKACASKFGFTSKQVSGPNGGSRDIATCDMDRDGFTLLAMGFTGKKALAWKLKYIEAFNAMEAIISQPIMATDDDQPRSRKPSIDKMDAGMDLLITAETAMHAQGYLDADTITAIRGTLGQAIKLLSPVREAVNRLS